MKCPNCHNKLGPLASKCPKCQTPIINPKASKAAQMEAAQKLKSEEPKLIECPSCSKQVSNQAASCPNCGHPFKPISKPPPVYQNAPAKKKTSPFTIIFLIGCASIFIVCWLIISSGSTGTSGGNSSTTPAISSFGISEGMHLDKVATQLKGKVSGIDYIGKKRVRNVATGELDGSSKRITTHSIYYDVPGTSRNLRVYFWDDVVRSVEWD